MKTYNPIKCETSDTIMIINKIWPLMMSNSLDKSKKAPTDCPKASHNLSKAFFKQFHVGVLDGSRIGI